MIILGIETSCDETAASLVENGTKILANVVASSQEMHAKTGGIIPETAARQQVKLIVPVVEEALVEAFEVRDKKWEDRKRSEKLEKKKSHLPHQNLISHLAPLISGIDAIAVTIGPGLIGSLLVGVETTKTLAYLWQKPIVPVNHLLAHIYANFVKTNNLELKTKNHNLNLKSEQPQFPLIALVVSGGHTDLVSLKGHAAPATLARSAGGRGKIKLLGTTRDDAAGECFDKCARILGLPYPGGPSIAAEAARYQLPDTRYRLNLFPRPMIDRDAFDFSFSGLKTSVVNQLTNQQINKFSSPRLAAEIQEAIVDSLVAKSIKAIEKYRPKSFLLAGGVAANSRLREKFADEIKTKRLRVAFHVPQAKLCTDNAAVIAACAFYHFQPVPWQKIAASPELTIVGDASNDESLETALTPIFEARAKFPKT